jgi:ATP-binding cassette, subfamily B, bacterial
MPASLLRNYREFVRNTLTALRAANRASRRMMWGILITSLLAAFVPVLSTLIWRDLINGATGLWSGQGGSLNSVVIPFIWLVTVTFVEIAVTRLNDYFDQTLQLELTTHVSMLTLEHAAELDLEYFEDPQFQDHLSRSSANVGQNVSQFLSNVIDLIRYALQTISLAFLLAAIDPLVILIVIPLIVPYGYYNLRIAQMRYDKQVRQTTRKRWSTFYTRRLMDSDYIPEVKVFGLEELLLNRYRTLLKDLKREDYNLIIKAGLVASTFFDVLFALLSIGLLVYAALRVYFGTLRVGDLVVYLRSSQQFSAFALRIGKSFSGLAEQSLYVEEWQRFMNSKPIMSHTVGSRPDLAGDIVFDDVSFQYPKTKRPTLHHIHLHLAAGETVAIVGENGAGKSTLVKLLLRLYDVNGGVIKLGGHDLRDINLAYLHQQYSYVPQHFNRFEGTAAENIAFGDWRRLLNNPEAVAEVARQAGIDGMIVDMPQGYQTMLGRKFGDYEPSGGQWQKIAIARAMARNSLVMVLDEPTASLDARSEYEIFSKIKTLAAGRTAIIISHRFSTIAMADRIIVMEKGCIVEQGTHAALMDRNGLYRQMYALHLRQMTRESQAPADITDDDSSIGRA